MADTAAAKDHAVSASLREWQWSNCTHNKEGSPKPQGSVCGACAVAWHLNGIEDRERQHKAALDAVRIERDYARMRLDRHAAHLADEVAALVKRRVIDSRSPAADALLDFRDPPSSPRADRLAKLERESESFRKQLLGEREARCDREAEVELLQARVGELTEAVERSGAAVREARQAERDLRLRLDCGKIGDDACGDCGKCWQLATLRTGVDLLDARHILSRLVTTIRWVCESRPDVAAALEINLAWIRAVELLEAHCPEKEAPCSPAT